MPDTPSTPQRRVFIIEDHPAYQVGLAGFLNAQPDLCCCGVADHSQTALEAIRTLAPDLVILDLRLHEEDGMEILRRLQHAHPALPVLVLSHLDETVHAALALRAGARGYVMKGASNAELLEAIHNVLRGEQYVGPALASLLVKGFFDRREADPISQTLSDRELQVLHLLGTGLPTREVASRLGLSVKTVETHRENIKLKLNLPDAAALELTARQWVKRFC